MSADELVTVVVPARNEESFIGACLESVLAQDWAALEVIVVDGASTDRTAEIVRTYQERDGRIRLLKNPNGTISPSLNLALDSSRGTWLVRVDAHCTIPQDYVRRIVKHLETGRWGGVGGRKDGLGVTSAGRAIAVAMASPFGVGDSLYHYGTEPQVVDHIPFGAYPAELARQLGGWDIELPVNQDYEFDYRVRRAGHQLLFDPSIVINWYCRQSIGDLWRQYRRYGRDKARMLAKSPRSVRPRHLAAPALIGCWTLACVFLVTKRARWAAVLTIPYPAAVAGASLKAMGRLATLDDRRFLPLAFLAMHSGWGQGFWEGLADHIRHIPESGAQISFSGRVGGRRRL
ncbi:MAG: glycosyltransferase family 2 protein [Actinobacteria bacterium]|nr:MAG: glycosyltransferase family 2 protein [Actinomycetota bacterium]